VSDVLREFQAIVESLSAGVSSTEVLLRLMPADSAAQLRLCAIPHEFNPRVLRTLVPALDPAAAERRCEEFAELSSVVNVPGGLALNAAARAELFRDWLRPERRDEFHQASARLVASLDNGVSATSSAESEAQQHSRMFHMLGADEERGVTEFEHLCRRARRARRLAVCGTLIRLAHEYDPVLTPAHVATLTYHEGKLAADRRQWDGAEQLFRRVVETPAAPADVVVKTYLRLGELAAEQGDFDQAIKNYGLAQTRSTEWPGVTTPRYHILRSLGEAYRERGDDAQAERFFTDSLELSLSANDRLASADTFNSLGTLYWRRREVEKATEAYQKSLGYLLEAGRRFQAAQVYNNLGVIYADGADWEEAQRAYEQSLEIKRQADDSLGQARTLTNLVAVYQGQGRLEAATDACLDAIRLFEEVRHLRGLAHAKRMLGRLYLARDQREAARTAFRESAELFERQHADREAAIVRDELATVDARGGIPTWVWIAGIVIVLVVVIILIIIASS